MQRISGLSATDCKLVDTGCGQALNSVMGAPRAARPNHGFAGVTCRPDRNRMKSLNSGGLDGFYLEYVKIALAEGNQEARSEP